MPTELIFASALSISDCSCHVRSVKGWKINTNLVSVHVFDAVSLQYVQFTLNVLVVLDSTDWKTVLLSPKHFLRISIRSKQTRLSCFYVYGPFFLNFGCIFTIQFFFRSVQFAKKNANVFFMKGRPLISIPNLVIISFNSAFPVIHLDL